MHPPLIAALLGAGAVVLLVIGYWPRESVRGLTVALAIGIEVVGGAISAPDPIRYGSLAASLALMLFGVLRGARGRGFNCPATLMVVWLSFTAASTAVLERGSLENAVFLVILPLTSTALASKFRQSDLRVLFSGLIVVASGELLAAGFQLVSGTTPLWGYSDLTEAGTPVLRYNPFFGGSVLRAQGTTGHPIIFATLMIITLCACLTPVLRSKPRIRALGIVVALSGLALSGTRSAVFAAIVAILFYAISTRTFGARVRNGLLIVLAAIAVLVGNFGTRTVVSDLLASSSLAHRVSGWTSAASLLHRAPEHVLFGSGAFSADELFRAGFLQQDGFQVIDNQFIWSLGLTGVVGLVLLVAALATAMRFQERSGRMLLVAICTMFFSFDVVTWQVDAIVLAIVVAIPKTAWALTREAEGITAPITLAHAAPRVATRQPII